jgi:hypothetical protein
VLLATVLLLVAAALLAVRLIGVWPTTAADSALTDQCDEVPAAAERLVLTAGDGFELGAAVVGPADASAGVVLRQGAGQTICDWLPLAGRISSETGTRVLLFDRRGRASSPGEADLTAEPDDLLTAAGWLREHGAERVGLIASSMGNSVQFAALPDLVPAPCVVVAVSPVLVSSDDHGEVDGTALAGVPDHVRRDNVWVVSESGNADVAAYAHQVADASGTEHLLLIDTDAHSIGLVRKFPEAADFIVEAVASCR